MMYLKAKYLEVKELPEKPPYPRSCLLSLLMGVESVSLICKDEVREALEDCQQFEDLLFEVQPRQVDLSQIGGKGKAYRLTVTRVVSSEEIR